MSDMYHENTMLSAENENLRLRVKSLQETIDAQTQQIAELKATTVLGKIGEGIIFLFCVYDIYGSYISLFHNLVYT